jgi:hypothetical protein
MLWLLLAGIAVYRMLTGDRGLTHSLVFLAAVLLNVGVLLLSFWNVVREEPPVATRRGGLPPEDDDGP